MPEKMREGSSSYLVSLLKGMVLCFAILVVASLILGVLSSMDVIQEELANQILLVINYIAIFIGGIFTARKVDTRGWLNGGLVGLLYMVVVVIIGMQIVSIAIGFQMLLRIVSGFITGALGGVIGVNIKY